MSGRPCVMSSSVYSSSWMQLKSLRRPWISGRRCCRKHVFRDSSHVCRVHGTPTHTTNTHLSLHGIYAAQKSVPRLAVDMYLCLILYCISINPCSDSLWWEMKAVKACSNQNQWILTCCRCDGSRAVWLLTQAADVYGNVHMAVFGAVVHGLSEGPQFRLACAQCALWVACSFLAASLWALSQDLF